VSIGGKRVTGEKNLKSKRTRAMEKGGVRPLGGNHHKPPRLEPEGECPDGRERYTSTDQQGGRTRTHAGGP